MSHPRRKILLVAVIVLVLAEAIYFALTQLNQRNITDSKLAPTEIPGKVVYMPCPVEIALYREISVWEGIPVSEVVDQEARDPAENGSLQFSVATDMDNFYITNQMPDKTIIAGEHCTVNWNEDSFEF